MIRWLPLALLLAVVACGGGSGTSSPTPDTLDVDPETARAWAEDALRSAGLTAAMYNASAVLPDRAVEQRDEAESLAAEIRDSGTNSELALRLAEDLDAYVAALDYAVEYARNSGLPSLNIVIPGLVASINAVGRDATALKESLPEP